MQKNISDFQKNKKIEERIRLGVPILPDDTTVSRILQHTKKYNIRNKVRKETEERILDHRTNRIDFFDINEEED